MSVAARARAQRAKALRGQVYHGGDPVPGFILRALARVTAAVARAKKRSAMGPGDHPVIVRCAPSAKSRVLAGPSTWAIAILHGGVWFYPVRRVHQPGLVASFVREIDALQSWPRGRKATA